MNIEPTVESTNSGIRTTRPPRSTGKMPLSRAKNEARKGPAQTAESNQHNDAPAPDEIRHAAYLRWIAAGSPECDGVEFWLAAESELAQTASASMNKSS